MKIYSLFDRKSQAFEMASLMLFKNDAIAYRSIKAAAKGNAFGPLVTQYPEDFELYCLGVFDSNTGDVVQADEKRYLISLSELLEEVKNG